MALKAACVGTVRNFCDIPTGVHVCSRHFDVTWVVVFSASHFVRCLLFVACSVWVYRIFFWVFAVHMCYSVERKTVLVQCFATVAVRTALWLFCKKFRWIKDEIAYVICSAPLLLFLSHSGLSKMLYSRVLFSWRCSWRPHETKKKEALLSASVRYLA
jgi:hypothetical protein